MVEEKGKIEKIKLNIKLKDVLAELRKRAKTEGLKPLKFTKLSSRPEIKRA